MIDPFAQQMIAVGGPGLGALWLVLKYKPWKNGSNGQQKYNDDVEYGKLMQKVEALEETTGGLVDIVGKLQTQVAVVASNVKGLSEQMAKK